VPLGKRKARGNFIVWFWLAMFLTGLAQLGGIVGAVGQAMAITWPISEKGLAYNIALDNKVKLQVAESQLKLIEAKDTEPTDELNTEIAELRFQVVDSHLALLDKYTVEPTDHQQYAIAHLKLKAAELKLVLLETDGSTATNDLKAEITELKLKADSIPEPEIDEAVKEKTKNNSLVASFEALPEKEKPASSDDKLWGALITAITICVLISGRYGFIESFSMILVGCFTIITIGNLFELQRYSEWAVTWANIKEGLSFGLPEKTAEINPLSTALATFGIIGVGAAELVAYPYWCLEKGYGKWTGPHDTSDAWADRAKGWMKVMKWDAWGSMVVYTFATVAFYLLGAAILNRTGLNPEGTELIRTLAAMYEPVFGAFAHAIFLFGAIAVLYSTFFVANAAKTRLATDVLDAFGIVKLTDETRRWWIRLFSVLFPLACISVYILYPKPAVLVLIAGVMQALLLPMLGGAALYFRYKHCDERLKPSILWDILLWISFGGFLIVGLYLTYDKLFAG
jgi:hypothetical protein